MKTLLLILTFFTFLVSESVIAQKTDTLQVRFLYGSRPKPEHKKHQKRWFGGMLGGHVGIQYDSVSYLSFFYLGRVHIFQHKNNPSGLYELQSKDTFNLIMDKDVDSVKTLIIKIPITEVQRTEFEALCAQYIKKTPYDYAFFGIRCGSSTYDVLSKIGILKKRSYFGTWTRTFYPRILRRRLIYLAKKNDWEMKRKKGTHKRIWEKD
jgi:hypothetical protein